MQGQAHEFDGPDKVYGENTSYLGQMRSDQVDANGNR
jgi:hypothetical protein